MLRKLIRAGKNWRTPKKPFRPTAGLKSYEKRLQDRNNMAAMKEREKEMKDEKEAERQVVLSPWWNMSTTLTRSLQRHIQAIKDRRAAKEEKERYEKMAEKMHKKRVERRRRREKRNKLLNS